MQSPHATRELNNLTESAPTWADIFHCMGDSTRLKLLMAMHYWGPGEATVTQLAAHSGVKMPTASAALGYLKARGIVEATKSGREVTYRLADHDIHHLLHFIGAGHHKDLA